MSKRTIWIGTSGWVYKQWAGNFYPKGWPKKSEFEYYVRHFPTVEINATFYRLPSRTMVRGWHDKAPPGFVFAVKGSRYLTHIKRLKDTGKGLQKYFRRLRPLGDRTGPILWQLPPNFTKTEAHLRRLERFLAKLPPQYRHAIEFRHPSWMDEETFALLRRHRAANVWLSSLRMPADDTLTGEFAYLRFHGLKNGAYHDYTDSELEPWAKALAKVARQGLPAYVYFNNDLNTRAPSNAAALMHLVESHVVNAKSAEPPTILPEIARAKHGPEMWPAWTRPRARPKHSTPPPQTTRYRRARGAPIHPTSNPPRPTSSDSHRRSSPQVARRGKTPTRA